MAAEFSNQEKRSGRSRRSVCITNPGGFPQGLLIPGPAGPGQGAAADRTAAFLLPRAGVDQSLPYMALGTLPPDPAVAADRYHFRCQAPVEGRVPLGRHVWRLGGKVVEAGKDLPSRTVGTAHPPSAPVGKRRLARSDPRRTSTRPCAWSPPSPAGASGGRFSRHPIVGEASPYYSGSRIHIESAASRHIPFSVDFRGMDRP